MIIYKTTNTINGKIYVGQTYRSVENYFGSGVLISRAIEKYGAANFKRETLCECSSLENLDEMEMFWIKKLDSTNPTIGYNIDCGGKGTGFFSDEHKKKIGEAQLGSRNHRYGKPAWNRGIPQSDDTKKKIREKLTGNKMSESFKIKARNRQLGVNLSDDTKRKISKSKSGSIPWNKGLNGIKFSDEHRKNIGIAVRKRFLKNESAKE